MMAQAFGIVEVPPSLPPGSASGGSDGGGAGSPAIHWRSEVASSAARDWAHSAHSRLKLTVLRPSPTFAVSSCTSGTLLLAKASLALFSCARTAMLLADIDSTMILTSGECGGIAIDRPVRISATSSTILVLHLGSPRRTCLGSSPIVQTCGACCSPVLLAVMEYMTSRSPSKIC
jgi:hypothetical protein